MLRAAVQCDFGSLQGQGIHHCSGQAFICWPEPILAQGVSSPPNISFHSNGTTLLEGAAHRLPTAEVHFCVILTYSFALVPTLERLMLACPSGLMIYYWEEDFRGTIVFLLIVVQNKIFDIFFRNAIILGRIDWNG